MTKDEIEAALNKLEEPLWLNGGRSVPLIIRELLGVKHYETIRAALEAQLKDGTHPDMVMVPREVVNFLNGTGELEGVCFGEKNGYHNGNFWWRKYLGAA